MKEVIDEKVVKISFDNRDFEKRVSSTIKSIDQLKDSLDFENVADGIYSVSDASERLDFSNAEKSINDLTVKFKAFEVIALSVLSNITNKAIESAGRIVKSFSIDKVMDGFGAYGDMTTSVGTLIAQGYESSLVAEELGRLSWFTDETSYNFTQMVESISKFTASGQDLEQSVTAMMGIADWAALSGQNATTASRAMYQLAQAISSGSMALNDYRSIQTASMDTKEFREKAIEAAIAVGTLTKEIGNVNEKGEQLYTTLNGNNFSLNQFTEYLTSDKWFTSDVMMSVFKEYSGAVDGIRKATIRFADNELLASEAIQIFSKVQRNATGEIVDYSGMLEEATLIMGELSDEDVKSLKELSDQISDFGIKALKASQEARTFVDMITSIKDAVTSKWRDIFQNLFGGYEESVDIWTKLANHFYDVFAEPLQGIVNLLKDWGDSGGRASLFSDDEENLGALWEILYGLQNMSDVIHESFTNVFGEFDSDRLTKLVDGIKDFTHNIQLSETALIGLKNTMTGIFSVFKAALGILKSVYAVVSPLFKLIKPILDFALTITGAIGKLIETLVNSGIFDFIQEVGDRAGKLIDRLTSGVGSIKNVTDSIADAIVDGCAKVKKTLSPIESVIEGLIKLFTGAVKVVEAIGPMLSAILDTVGETLIKVAEGLVGIFTGESGDLIKQLLDGTLTALLMKGIYDLSYFISSLSAPLQYLSASIADTFWAISEMLEVKAFKEFAIAIAILAGSLIILASIDADALGNALSTLGIIMLEFKIFSSALSKTLTGIKGLAAVGVGLIFIATSLGIIASAIKRVSDIDLKQMIISVSGLSAAALVLLGVANAFAKMGAGALKGSGNMILLASSMYIMATAFVKLGSLNGESLFSSIAGLTAIMTAIIIFQEKASRNINPKAVGAIAASMMILSVAMLTFAVSMNILGRLSFDQMLVAIAGLLGIITSLVAFSKASERIQAGKVAAISGALIIFGIAIAGFVLSVLALGQLGLDKMAVGVMALVGIMGSLVLFSKAAEALKAGKIAAVSASLIVLGIALSTFVASVVMFGMMGSDKVLAGLLGIVGIMTMVAVFGKVAEMINPLQLLAVAGSMIVLGIGLTSMALAAKIFSTIDVAGIIKTAVILGSILAGLGLAATLLGGLAPIILILAGSVALVGVGIQLIGLSIVLFAKGLAMVAALGTGATVAMKLLAETLFSMTTKIILGIAKGLIEAVEYVLDELPAILNKLFDIIIGFIPRAVETAVTVLSESLEIFVAKGEKIFESIFKIAGMAARAFVSAVADNIGFITTQLIRIITEIVNAVADGMDPIIESIFNLIEKTIYAVADGIVSFAPKLREAIKYLWTSMLKAILSFYGIDADKFVEIGKNIVAGIWNGIKKSWSNLVEGISNFGNGIKELFCKIFKISSPSKVFYEYGSYLDQGLANGIDEGAALVSESIKSMSDMITDGINSEPVIRPVMDLSEIQNGTNDIASIMNSISGKTVTADLATTAGTGIRSTTSRQYELDALNAERLKGVVESNSRGDTTEITNTFNITGDDPKEIANEVSKIIGSQITRKQAVWA